MLRRQKHVLSQSTTPLACTLLITLAPEFPGKKINKISLAVLPFAVFWFCSRMEERSGSLWGVEESRKWRAMGQVAMGREGGRGRWGM